MREYVQLYEDIHWLNMNLTNSYSWLHAYQDGLVITWTACKRSICGILQQMFLQCLNLQCFLVGGGNSNIFLFSPKIWERFPFWKIFFRWVEPQPPTRFLLKYWNWIYFFLTFGLFSDSGYTMGDYNSDLRSEVNGSGRGVVSPHQFSIKNHGGTWHQKRDWQEKGEAFDLSSCAFYLVLHF